MERTDETVVLLPEPSQAFTALQKPVPQNVDVSNRTVYMISPASQASGSLTAPINTTSARTIFSVSCPGNGKIDFAHTMLELRLQFWNGNPAVPGGMVNAVPIYDIFGAMVQNLTFSINGKANPIFASVPGKYLAQHLAYLFMTYSNQALESQPWLFSPCLSEYYGIRETAGALPITNPVHATYQTRLERWFDPTYDGTVSLSNNSGKVFHLTIPLRDVLCSRIGGDSAPLNVREFVLEIQWDPQVNDKGFVKLPGITAPPGAVLTAPACAVSLVGINMLVSTYVMSAGELISGTKDKIAGRDDIMPFLNPRPQDVAAGLSALYPSVANLDHVWIFQEAYGRTNLAGTQIYTDSTQWIVPNCYRSTGGGVNLVASYDGPTGAIANLVGTAWNLASITYGSISQFPSQPIVLVDGTRPVMDQAKFFYDLAIDRISKRDLVPAIPLHIMNKTMPFVVVRPWSPEGITCTRIAKDLILRFGAIGSGYAGQDTQITVVASRVEIYSIGVDGSVRKME